MPFINLLLGLTKYVDSAYGRSLLGLTLETLMPTQIFYARGWIGNRNLMSKPTHIRLRMADATGSDRIGLFPERPQPEHIVDVAPGFQFTINWIWNWDVYFGPQIRGLARNPVVMPKGSLSMQELLVQIQERDHTKLTQDDNNFIVPRGLMFTFDAKLLLPPSPEDGPRLSDRQRRRRVAEIDPNRFRIV